MPDLKAWLAPSLTQATDVRSPRGDNSSQSALLISVALLERDCIQLALIRLDSLGRIHEHNTDEIISFYKLCLNPCKEGYVITKGLVNDLIFSKLLL